MEMIGHLILYLLKGALPWQGLPGRSKIEKYNAIKRKKIEISIDELCNGHPAEFAEYMQHCRTLKYDQEPDYAKCLGLFESCMKKHNFTPKVRDYAWKKDPPKPKKVKTVK